MKSLICPIIILIIMSCTRQDMMIGRNILIKEFPQEINLSGEKLDITSIGVNNIFVVDTFLICYKAMGLDEFFDIYITNIIKFTHSTIYQYNKNNITYSICFLNR